MYQADQHNRDRLLDKAQRTDQRPLLVLGNVHYFVQQVGLHKRIERDQANLTKPLNPGLIRLALPAQAHRVIASDTVS